MSQALKAFVAGMGQTLDIGATRAPHRKKKGNQADHEALCTDWEKVGKSMSFAMRQAKPKTEKSYQPKTG